MPATAKSTMNPADTEAPTARARATLAPGRSLRSASPAPMKYDR